MRSTIRAGERRAVPVRIPSSTRRAALAALAALCLPARAQVWPARPLRLIVPSPSGSIGDLVARALAQALAAQVGRAVIVENRGGASGTIGMEALARAQPDGYTLAFSAIGPLTLSPAIGKVPYDAARDFTAVAAVMDSPVLLMATPAAFARDFGELLTRARDWPDTVRWASPGPASLGHLMLEQLQAAAGVRFVHIPYKGGAQQLADALGGQFEVLSMQATPALVDNIRMGRLRALAVGAPRRLASLPQIPTLAELGYPAANLSAHFGIFAPANLPLRLLDRINSEVNQALEAPPVRQRLQASENVATGGAARDFARLVTTEADNTLRIVRAVGIRLD
jgi:tripartite-type tricarboxylate transporter receptor subunit TctC